MKIFALCVLAKFLSIQAAAAQEALTMEPKTSTLEGKPVEIIHGSAVNSFTLQAVIESLEEAGCPVSTRVLSDSAYIVARTNGDGISTLDVVFAGSWLLENCLPKPPHRAQD